MEDAHIAEGELYALETNANTNTNSSNNDNDNDNSNDKRIALPGHALFAVYDGHGGTFAAIYSGNNFLRILSKQRAFVRYTKMCNADSNDSNNDSNINSDTTAKSKKAARAARKMKYLEQALKQAFVETDYEIGMAVRGKSHMDANSPYHEGKTSTTTTTNINTNTTDTNTDTNTTARTVQEGAVMKAASDHLAAIEDRGDSGTTSCVVMITPESIVCANAGDSRSVFARRPEVGVVDATTTANNDDDNDNSTDTDTDTNNDATTTATATTNATLGKAVPLSFDHKPDDEQEMLRIRAAGGYVGGGRVEGDLAVSRGLGDFRFKEMPVVLNNTQLFPDESYDGNDDANDGNGNGNGVTSTSTTTNGTNMDTTDDEGEDTCNSNSNSSNTNNNNQHPQKPKQPIIFPPGDQKVSPIPDVIVHARNPERDEYVVVACDGMGRCFQPAVRCRTGSNHVRRGGTRSGIGLGRDIGYVLAVRIQGQHDGDRHPVSGMREELRRCRESSAGKQGRQGRRRLGNNHSDHDDDDNDNGRRQTAARGRGRPAAKTRRGARRPASTAATTTRGVRWWW